MKYIDAFRMVKQATEVEAPNVKKTREQLVKLLDAKNSRDSVYWMSNEKMPTKHVVPYAKHVLEWEGPKRVNGRMDMYFNPEGYPLGYSLDEEDGIHTNASEEELNRALIVSLLSKARAKRMKLM